MLPIPTYDEMHPPAMSCNPSAHGVLTDQANPPETPMISVDGNFNPFTAWNRFQADFHV